MGILSQFTMEQFTIGNSGVFIKTERRFALFQDAPATQFAHQLRHLLFCVMLDDEHAGFAKQIVFESKIMHYKSVIRFVRRIEKADVPRDRVLASGKILSGEAE